jgi:hypothetical protein
LHTFDSVAATITARKIITLVLGIILLTRTIISFYQTSSLSSSFIRNAQAQSIDTLLEDIDCNNNNLNENDISIEIGRNTLQKNTKFIHDIHNNYKILSYQ